MIAEVDGEENELKISSGNSRGKHERNYWCKETSRVPWLTDRIRCLVLLCIII